MLNDRLVEAIEGHLGELGGGFVTGFVCAVDAVDADGEQVLLFATTDGQKTAASLGLVEFAKEWFLADARSLIAAQVFECECDEED